MTNERTLARVARIAAGILALKKPEAECCVWIEGSKAVWIKWSDIRALAASCLNQAPDKPKRTVKRKPRPKFIARRIALRHKRDGKGWVA